MSQRQPVHLPWEVGQDFLGCLAPPLSWSLMSSLTVRYSPSAPLTVFLLYVSLSLSRSETARWQSVGMINTVSSNNPDVSANLRPLKVRAAMVMRWLRKVRRVWVILVDIVSITTPLQTHCTLFCILARETGIWVMPLWHFVTLLIWKRSKKTNVFSSITTVFI